MIISTFFCFLLLWSLSKHLNKKGSLYVCVKCKVFLQLHLCADGASVMEGSTATEKYSLYKALHLIPCRALDVSKVSLDILDVERFVKKPAALLLRSKRTLELRLNVIGCIVLR